MGLGFNILEIMGFLCFAWDQMSVVVSSNVMCNAHIRLEFSWCD